MIQLQNCNCYKNCLKGVLSLCDALVDCMCRVGGWGW